MRAEFYEWLYVGCRAKPFNYSQNPWRSLGLYNRAYNLCLRVLRSEYDLSLWLRWHFFKLLNVQTAQRFGTLCVFTVTLPYALLLWTPSSPHTRNKTWRLFLGPEDAAELWNTHSAHVSTWKPLRTELSHKQPAMHSSVICRKSKWGLLKKRRNGQETYRLIADVLISKPTYESECAFLDQPLLLLGISAVITWWEGG